jgi:hypothetical protein
MAKRASAVFDGGKGLNEECWTTFMGRGDDIGDVGRLALRAAGNKKELKSIALVAGKMNAAYCLHLTLGLFQMDVTEVRRVGANTVERETMEALALFFSKTIYDHTFDYFPCFMQPTKSGNGFSDYDNIMGEWLGKGSPLTRDECLELAFEVHAWIDEYCEKLMRTKSWIVHLPVQSANLLLGTETSDAIGGTCSNFSLLERNWWR